MATFLSLCFSWTFFVALGIMFVVALLDIVYREGSHVMFDYPEHPKAQILTFALLAVIFIFWQAPLFADCYADHLVEILILRFILLVVWFFVARVLIKWLICGLAYVIIHSILNDFKRTLEKSDERLI